MIYQTLVSANYRGGRRCRRNRQSWCAVDQVKGVLMFRRVGLGGEGLIPITTAIKKQRCLTSIGEYRYQKGIETTLQTPTFTQLISCAAVVRKADSLHRPCYSPRSHTPSPLLPHITPPQTLLPRTLAHSSDGRPGRYPLRCLCTAFDRLARGRGSTSTAHPSRVSSQHYVQDKPLDNSTLG